MTETLNVGSKTNDWRAQLLSNFAHTPFVLFGIEFASVEGLWVGLKFPENSAEQKKAFTLAGYQAKKFGYDAPRTSTFTWRGKTYRVGSPEHQALMAQALWAKFTQDRAAREALLATQGLTLTHIMPRDSVTIPGAVFAGFLMEIRNLLTDSRRFVWNGHVYFLVEGECYKRRLLQKDRVHVMVMEYQESKRYSERTV